MEIVTGLFALLKDVSPKIAAISAIVSGILLFSPSEFISRVGLDEMLKSYHSHFGIAFLISIAVIAVECLFWIAKRIKARIREGEVKRNLQGMLAELTPSEKEYLAPYIFNQVNTQFFGVSDGIAQGLQAKGVLYRSSNIGNIFDGFPYNLQPWARQFLYENPELIADAPNVRRIT